MLLRGKVVAGLGVGRLFVTKHVYYLVLTEILGEEPCPGTLNLETDLTIEEIERSCPARRVKTATLDGVTLGGFRYWLGSLIESSGKKINVVVLRPDLSRHKSNVVEVVSSRCLRECLGIDSGDYVDLELRCS